MAVDSAASCSARSRVPSGKLAIFDIGLFGYLPRPALEPAIMRSTSRRDRPLAVVGARRPRSVRERWDHVAIVLEHRSLVDGVDPADPILHSKKLGDVPASTSRGSPHRSRALDHWQHEDSLDGHADFMFWGRDEAMLAHVLCAPNAQAKATGWTDLVVGVPRRRPISRRSKAENSGCSRWICARTRITFTRARRRARAPDRRRHARGRRRAAAVVLHELGRRRVPGLLDREPTTARSRSASSSPLSSESRVLPRYADACG